MDFVVGLPRAQQQHDAVLVVVDRLTKMAHFVPTTTTCTAERVATLFLWNVVRLHGVPKTVISDRDSWFVGTFWQALARLIDLRVNLSSSFHP